VCTCYDNWGVGLSYDSGDCSDRICPFEIAWVDTPDLNGNFHKYLECSGRGICARDTGECACFDGYEGKGCQRTTCPNDCSGHGTCEYIEDLKYGASWNDYNAVGFYDTAATFPYRNWDKHKERTCVCDALYGDVDCSKKMCPYGNDVLDVRSDQDILLKKQVQTIWFNFAAIEAINGNVNGHTFALVFKSKLNETFTTIPIVFQTATPLTNFINDIQLALLMLPNRVIDGVSVSAAKVLTNSYAVQVTFTGNSVQGPQHLLTVLDYQCGDGCTPKITGIPVETRVFTTAYPSPANINSNITETVKADYNSFECGRRGKCDYATGLCQCFSGYTGDNCNTLHALF